MTPNTSEKNTTSSKTNMGNWIRFVIATILLLVFLYWIESWWGLIVLPFLFDAYITHLIPWYWWRKSKNKNIHAIMSWVDAIVFALVAVYFVNLYFFQNYVIPSSSLEKSLLTGDYLFVSKMSYGPRAPMTPLHMPLTSHTIPVLNTKSYLTYPQWEYKRIKGFGSIQQGDIVVFNYPAGDTVVLNLQNADYYTICYEFGKQLLPNKDSLTIEEEMKISQEQYEAGRNYIKNNENQFGKIASRPVDMRENYVKRCVGLPGQEFSIKDGIVFTDGKAMKQPDNVQQNYIVRLKYEIPEDFCREYNITIEDRSENYDDFNIISRNMPLTKRALEALKLRTDFVYSIDPAPSTDGIALYPHSKKTGWTCANYGPIWIPKKGEKINLTLDNLPIYRRPIEIYENNKLQIKDGKIFINDKEETSYTFKMDYYWMMGDNRDNSADSRFWGFVPEDHIVGKPILIWLSLNKDYDWLDGKIRFSRLFHFVDEYK